MSSTKGHSMATDAAHVYYPINIYSNNSFTTKYYNWFQNKVNLLFKRNPERAADTVQNVRMKCIKKDLIGRWFFKHLTDDLVDTAQGTKILGVDISFVTAIKPVSGNRYIAKGKQDA